MTKIEEIKQKIISNFSDLEFEEKDHRYNLKGKPLSSVSKSIEIYKKKFDSNNIAIAYAKKHKRRVDDVLEEWQAENTKSIELGHRVHTYAEDCFYKKNEEPSDLYEQSVIEYFNSLPKHQIPFMSEVRLYSDKLEFAGTTDLLIYDEEKEGVIIVDYKTNKNIYKNFAGQKMNSPFNYLLDMPFNTYQLQLSMYQIPLEDIGIEVVGREIVWFKSDGSYEKISVNNFTNHLRYYKMLNNN